MNKELCQFSIACKKELESNFEAIAQLVERHPQVQEECVAKVAVLWLASIDLMIKFDEKQSEINNDHPDMAISQFNLQSHFHNYLREKSLLATMHTFVTHDNYCGWLGQIEALPQYQSTSLYEKMSHLPQAISTITGYEAIRKARRIQMTTGSKLQNDIIHHYIYDAPESNFTHDGCKRHLNEVMSSTTFKLSDDKLIQGLLYLQITIMIYALFTNLVGLMVFSLFSLTLLDTWQTTSQYSLSNIEKLNAQALESYSHKNNPISDTLCRTILHNRKATSKINFHLAVATPVATAELVPNSPKRERSNPGLRHEPPATPLRIGL